MNKYGGKNRVLWAVDAFGDGVDFQNQILQFLGQMAEAGNAIIEPIYVLSPDQLGPPVEFGSAGKDHYLPAIQKALHQRLKDLNIKNLEPAKVLIHERPSLKGAVKLLSEYAESKKYDLIVTSSHSRKGASRLVLGSFAEELILKSKVPVIVFNPNSSGSPSHISALHGEKQIIFATDFSEESHAAFNEMIDLAATLKTKVVLLHVIKKPLEPVIQSGVYLISGGWIPTPEFIEQELVEARKTAERWVKKCEKYQVPVEIVIDTASNGVVDAILDHSTRRKPYLIAMAAQSGPLTVALLGSITRQTVRNAASPVWVMHPGSGK